MFGIFRMPVILCDLAAISRADLVRIADMQFVEVFLGGEVNEDAAFANFNRKIRASHSRSPW